MEKTKRDKISEKALEIINETKSNGIRFSELIDRLIKDFPGDSQHTITNAVKFLKSNPKYKDKLAGKESVGRLYMLKSYPIRPESGKKLTSQVKEEEFYSLFSTYLKEDLHECDYAKEYGSHRDNEYWGNPDVIGVSSVNEDARFKSMPELTSVEIKISKEYRDIIKGFGQAVAYLLFSQKSYLVVPDSLGGDPLDKIETLCISLGIGVVLFKPENLENPSFKLRNRAKHLEPDIYYFNKIGVKMIDFLNEQKSKEDDENEGGED